MERGIDGIGRRLWGVDDNSGKVGRPCRIAKEGKERNTPR